MYRYSCIFLLIVTFSVGCSTSPPIQPTVNSLVSAGQFKYAAFMLEQHEGAYGARNELLYLLDAGMVYHLSGQYQKSINAFNQAKKIYEQTRPRSISQEIDAIIFNDNRRNYRAEIYERILINIFQALNYILTDQYNKALVEARDADLQLRTWQSYGDDDDEIYHYTEAFIRFFSGLIYENIPTRNNLRDALIDYEHAYKLYKLSYEKIDNVRVPALLGQRIEGLKSILASYKKREVEGNRTGVLIVVVYKGVVPIKYERSVSVPIDGILTKIAVPVMEKRGFELSSTKVEIKNRKNPRVEVSNERPMLNIADIAVLRHADKMKVVIPKAIARAGAKLIAQRELRKKIEEDRGDTTARWFSYASGIYNYISENADLRSWQSLPAGVYVTRFELTPGIYDVFIDNEVIAESVRVDSGVQFVLGRRGFK